jgi:hypothetical protein
MRHPTPGSLSKRGGEEGDERRAARGSTHRFDEQSLHALEVHEVEGQRQQRRAQAAKAIESAGCGAVLLGGLRRRGCGRRLIREKTSLEGRRRRGGGTLDSHDDDESDALGP